jgi:hypothetical protein
VHRPVDGYLFNAIVVIVAAVPARRSAFFYILKSAYRVLAQTVLVVEVVLYDRPTEGPVQTSSQTSPLTSSFESVDVSPKLPLQIVLIPNFLDERHSHVDLGFRLCGGGGGGGDRGDVRFFLGFATEIVALATMHRFEFRTASRRRRRRR